MAGLILALLLASSPTDQFVKANGVTLRYVDWGNPARVRHIVYLDAAYDMRAAMDAAVRADLIKPDAKAGAFPLDRIDDGAKATRMDYRDMSAPALAFFVETIRGFLTNR